jgi:hypothetical protein
MEGDALHNGMVHIKYTVQPLGNLVPGRSVYARDIVGGAWSGQFHRFEHKAETPPAFKAQSEWVWGKKSASENQLQEKPRTRLM